MKNTIYLTILIFSLFSFNTQSTRQQAVLDYPIQIGWVNDFEAVFTPEQVISLDSLLADYERRTSVEIAVVTIPSSATEKESFNELVFEIAKNWEVGKADKDNGILIGISKGHRSIWIANGIGIEKIMSNLDTKKVIDKNIIPKFKKDEFYVGTLNGIVEIIKILDQNIERRDER